MIGQPSNLEYKDTIVIWMNGVAQEEVQVIFEDGKKHAETSPSAP